MRTTLLLGLAALCPVLAAPPVSGADAPPASPPRFRVQEIDHTLGVGYGVKIVDINGDGRPDVVVADSARVVWFENPGPAAGSDAPWKPHVILDDKQAGIRHDNVCIDAADLDGDGKVDLVLGADWQPGNTSGGGSLYWLSRGKDLDEPWTPHPILDRLPTLHRAHFGRLDGRTEGPPQLIVGPLKGDGSTGAKNFTDVGSHLLVFDVPKDPAKDKWEPRVLSDELHVLHNFLAVPPMGPSGRSVADGSKAMQVLTASYEGVNLLVPAGDSGRWTRVQLGAGDQSGPGGSRGSSEIKIGHLKGGGAFLATIEPFHGNQAVVYTPPAGNSGLWTRKVLDEKLQEGHAVWCADLNGDGSDSIIVGWRQGDRPGIRVFTPTGGAAGAPEWSATDVDPGGVAVEDLAAADLNGDGRVDVVAVGRATHNVRIYWNEGK